MLNDDSHASYVFNNKQVVNALMELDKFNKRMVPRIKHKEIDLFFQDDKVFACVLNKDFLIFGSIPISTIEKQPMIPYLLTLDKNEYTQIVKTFKNRNRSDFLRLITTRLESNTYRHEFENALHSLIYSSRVDQDSRLNTFTKELINTDVATIAKALNKFNEIEDNQKFNVIKLAIDNFANMVDTQNFSINVVYTSKDYIASTIINDTSIDLVDVNLMMEQFTLLSSANI
jgi:hypothetical protein